MIRIGANGDSVMGYVVGVDIGGTFTDIVAMDPHGHVRVNKVESTPEDYSQGVMAAFNSLDLKGSDIVFFSHGSTVATNAILERRGGKTGLITTRGFESILEVGRANRQDLLNYWWRPQPPLVHRRDRVGVDERTDAFGNVRSEVSQESVRRLVDYFARRGVESIAICLINSYANRHNEEVVGDIVRNHWRNGYVTCSIDISPEMHEFERTSTTVVNAYLKPVMEEYLTRLRRRTKEGGYLGDILVMNSAGGLLTADSASSRPAALLMSGPAAGAIAAAALSASADASNLIALDVGGTSTDVSLVHDGELRFTNNYNVQFNIPVRLPTVDVHTVGAGGGSVAWIDVGGSLRVGPKSAGAIPGPVSYGRGGREPTVTDAAVVLGWIEAQMWRHLYGWSLNTAEATSTIKHEIGKPLGLGVQEAAVAILRVAISNIHQAVRAVTVERGLDPRDFRLTTGGGAGPMLAAYLARELGVSEAIIPPVPGVMSALGLLQSDVRVDFQDSILKREDTVDPEDIDLLFEHLTRTAIKHLTQEGFSRERIIVTRQIDVQYFGQTRYLTVNVPDGIFRSESLSVVVDRFLRAHLREYGYTMPQEAAHIELVNARVSARVRRTRIDMTREKSLKDEIAGIESRRDVFFLDGGSSFPTSVQWRDFFDSFTPVKGPLIIQQRDTTVVVPPGTSIRADAMGNLILHTD